MPPTTLQHRAPPASGGGQRLAPSAFSGETRLRELEHLAETARRVRDQAAAELARQGSAHHIARDRIAAAERMLQKAEKEIAELKAELETAPPPAPASEPAASVQDFELAVLLGHSKARFGGAGQATSTLQLEQGKPASPRVRAAARTDNRAPAGPTTARRGAAPATRSHSLVLGLLAILGVALISFGTYMLSSTDATSQVARQSMATLISGLAGGHSADNATRPVPATATAQ